MFPSEQAKTDNKREDLARVSNFKAKLSDYFQGDYTAVIGTGMYRDDELREIKLDIPVQFNGKAEIIGYTICSRACYGILPELYESTSND